MHASIRDAACDVADELGISCLAAKCAAAFPHLLPKKGLRHNVARMAYLGCQAAAAVALMVCAGSNGMGRQPCARMQPSWT